MGLVHYGVNVHWLNHIIIILCTPGSYGLNKFIVISAFDHDKQALLYNRAITIIRNSTSLHVQVLYTISMKVNRHLIFELYFHHSVATCSLNYCIEGNFKGRNCCKLVGSKHFTENTFVECILKILWKKLSQVALKQIH